MPFKIFRILFPKSNNSSITYHKTNSVILTTYNQSSIEHLGVCTVQSRHRDRTVKCTFFVVARDGSALVRMPDIELLHILKITCELMEGPHKTRMFNSQTMQAEAARQTKPKRSRQIMSIYIILIQTCQIIICPASTKQLTKEQVKYKWTKYTIHLGISLGIGCFEGTFSLQVKDYKRIK